MPRESPVRPRHVELRDIEITDENPRPLTPHPIKNKKTIQTQTELVVTPRKNYCDICFQIFILSMVSVGLIYIMYYVGRIVYYYIKFKT